MSHTPGFYLTAGLCLLVAVLLPRLVSRLPLSPPIVLVVIGMLIGWSPLADGLSLQPQEQRATIEHVTELTVLVALMGVGLAIDRPLRPGRWASWRRWSPAWRLLALTMPLSIGAVALLGWWWAGLAPASALLLGAVLAPTDPVLASDVQVGGPLVGDELDEHDRPAGHEHGHERDEVRFALTAEAGLNDGLAFPFVHLALLVGAGTLGSAGAAAEWVSWYLVGKVLLGVAVGMGTGWLLGRIAFRGRREAVRVAEQNEPLLAVAALLATYGAAEVVGGYGFLAVFACAMTLRAVERGHHYHRAMHGVVERLERLLTLAVLLCLGIASTRGLLDALDLRGVLVGLALLFLVRPLAGALALALAPRRRTATGGLGRSEIPAVAFFGVRGVGSLYYLAYATGHGHTADVPWLWSTVAFTVIASVLVHGTTATPVMLWLDRRRGWR